MFETLPLNAAQGYAAGLTLALIGLTVILRPGLRRLLTLLLQRRAPAWIEWGTLLVQIIFLSAGLGLIVGWLGVSTVVAVLASLLLWLLVASLRPGRRLTGWTSLRTGLKPASQPNLPSTSTTVAPLLAPVATSSEPAPVAVRIEPKAELAIAALSATPVPESAVVLMPPLTTDVAPAAVVTQPKLPRPAVALTRRRALGKKTTTGLL